MFIDTIVVAPASRDKHFRDNFGNRIDYVQEWIDEIDNPEMAEVLLKRMELDTKRYREKYGIPQQPQYRPLQ